MYKRMKWFLVMLTGSVWMACSTPECIQCNNVDGYPNGTICRDTYETSLQENTPSWKTYASDGLAAGCAEAE